MSLFAALQSSSRPSWSGSGLSLYMYPTNPHAGTAINNDSKIQQRFAYRQSQLLKPQSVLSRNCPPTCEKLPSNWPRSSLKMMSQIVEWIHGLSIGDRSMVHPVVVLLEELPAARVISTIKVFVCGITFGSSAALPFLYPLELRTLYLMYSIILFLH